MGDCVSSSCLAHPEMDCMWMLTIHGTALHQRNNEAPSAIWLRVNQAQFDLLVDYGASQVGIRGAGCSSLSLYLKNGSTCRPLESNYKFTNWSKRVLCNILPTTGGGETDATHKKLSLPTSLLISLFSAPREDLSFAWHSCCDRRMSFSCFIQSFIPPLTHSLSLVMLTMN